mmetsp:Transcript_30869/g.87336  ORF Transcript_30869/g.87336 Transcript_30869/m.87336 type:complete len:1574 (-) Transcript_30869:98-4819(-)
MHRSTSHRLSAFLLLQLACLLLPEDARAHHGLFTATIAPPTVPSAKVKHQLKLGIKDEAGKGIPLSDLQVVHERLLHIMVVSADWQSFVHIHPEDALQDERENEQGIVTLELEFPSDGPYVFMVEFAVQGASTQAALQIIDLEAFIQVGGRTQETAVGAQPQEETLSASGAGFSLENPRAVMPFLSIRPAVASSGTLLTADLTVNKGKPLFVGSCAELSFTYSLGSGDSLQGDAELSPILGAASHIAIAHQSMDRDTLTHTHAMVATHSSNGGSGMASLSDPCAMDMLEMAPPPDKIGSHIVAYQRFPKAGRYLIAAQVQVGNETMVTRSVVKVLELPVTLYTNPEGPVEAGQSVELEIRLAAQSFWGPSPTATVEATVSCADLKNFTHLQLSPSPEEGLQGGLRAATVFPSAGLYHIAVQGALHTDTQSIAFVRNFTLDVTGVPPMKPMINALVRTPVGRFKSQKVSMLSLSGDGTQEEMTAHDIEGFTATSGDVKMTLEVDRGGVAVVGHCVQLAFGALTSKTVSFQLAAADGDIGSAVVVRRNSSGGQDDLQRLAMVPKDFVTGTLTAEGYGETDQKELVRRMCTPMAQPVRAPTASRAQEAVTFVTFRQPGEHLVAVTLKTSHGELSGRFVVTVCPDSSEPMLWSSPCTWSVAPGDGERALIPGGKHIVLDESTAELEELTIRGTLEVARDGKAMLLNAARIILEKGGQLLAGTEEEPFEGNLAIRLHRGQLAVLGSGELAGGGLFGVSGGTVRLVGSRVAGQDGTRLRLRSEAAAGTSVLSFDPESVDWIRGGQHLLLSNAPSSTGPHTAEEVIVKSVKDGGQVTLGAPLKHAYLADAAVTRTSRSIQLTSKQYNDGGGCLKMVPPVTRPMVDGGAYISAAHQAAPSRRRLLEDELSPELDISPPELDNDFHKLGSGGVRRLLHSDPTASLSRPGDVMVAGGGDGSTYFVVNNSMSVVLDGVEINGMGKTGDRHPAVLFSRPEDYCGLWDDPRNLPAEVHVRRSSMYGLHGACVEIEGLPSHLAVEGNVCYGGKGDGFVVKGLRSSCARGNITTATVTDNLIVNVADKNGQRSATALGLGLPPAGIRLEDLSDDGPAGSQISVHVDRNEVAGSSGHGIAAVRSAATTMDSNVAHHNRLTGLLYGPSNSCTYVAPPASATAVPAEAPPASPIRNITLLSNGESQVCMEAASLGLFQTKAVSQEALALSASEVPEVVALSPGVWSDEVQIAANPVAHMRYFQIFVPEDAVSVKLMVDQVQGLVDVLLNPFGGAPCHQKFAGCKPAALPAGEQMRSKIRGIGTGFSASPNQPVSMLNIPQPAYQTGANWVVGVGCPGCTFRLGINVTGCGTGWMGFPSKELSLSPALTTYYSREHLLEQAGFNFTCVPVVNAKVNEPVGNLTLLGTHASVFLKTEVPEFTSQLWTRVRRVEHSGPPSSLHFRTYSGRLPTFSPGKATSAQTLTSLVDVTTAAPDVREAMEVEDANVPVDHFSMMMMFLRPGPYYTVVTQGAKEPAATGILTEAKVEVEVGAVSCETGDHVSAEPYFFPPHHIEDMVLSAKEAPVKRHGSLI